MSSLLVSYHSYIKDRENMEIKEFFLLLAKEIRIYVSARAILLLVTLMRAIMERLKGLLSEIRRGITGRLNMLCGGFCECDRTPFLVLIFCCISVFRY